MAANQVRRHQPVWRIASSLSIAGYLYVRRSSGGLWRSGRREGGRPGVRGWHEPAATGAVVTHTGPDAPLLDPAASRAVLRVRPLGRDALPAVLAEPRVHTSVNGVAGWSLQEPHQGRMVLALAQHSGPRPRSTDTGSDNVLPHRSHLARRTSSASQGFWQRRCGRGGGNSGRPGRA
jgi:hypothetical protein